MVGCPDKGQHPPHPIGCPDTFAPYLQAAGPATVVVRADDLERLLRLGPVAIDRDRLDRLHKVLATARNSGLLS
jgi:hypothetical protein